MGTLRDRFDFQRFAGNAKLGSMIRRAEERYGTKICFEDLELINAAGSPDMLQKKQEDLQ